MITVCAWCPSNGREAAILGDDGVDDKKESHGICQPCADILVDEEMDELEGDGLDPLDTGDDEDEDPFDDDGYYDDDDDDDEEICGYDWL